MTFLKKLFSRAPVDGPTAGDGGDAQGHAVLIRINAADLSGSEDDIDDLATLEDEIQEAIGDTGEVDGHDVGEEDAAVYCYGSDADEMFNLMRPTLEQSSLAGKAIVTLRYGGPDSESQRMVNLAS